MTALAAFWVGVLVGGAAVGVALVVIGTVLLSAGSARLR
jgi:hypothetical protein